MRFTKEGDRVVMSLCGTDYVLDEDQLRAIAEFRSAHDPIVTRAFELLPAPRKGIPDTIETRAAWAAQEIENYRELANAVMKATNKTTLIVRIGDGSISFTGGKIDETDMAEIVANILEERGKVKMFFDRIKSKETESAKSNGPENPEGST